MLGDSGGGSILTASPFSLCEYDRGTCWKDYNGSTALLHDVRSIIHGTWYVAFILPGIPGMIQYVESLVSGVVSVSYEKKNEIRVFWP